MVFITLVSTRNWFFLVGAYTKTPIDLGSGKVLWRQAFNFKTIISIPQLGLPVFLYWLGLLLRCHYRFGVSSSRCVRFSFLKGIFSNIYKSEKYATIGYKQKKAREPVKIKNQYNDKTYKDD
jgi:hypothetical protein